MAIEDTFPFQELEALARRESGARIHFRPVYAVHKWWARRLGSVFRAIILSVFDDTQNPAGSAGLREGGNTVSVWERYYRGNNLGGKVVLDPFMGGGTTVVEALRLGCKVIGVDLNPVAWWTVRQQVESADLELLEAEFRRLEQETAPRVQAFYRTSCPSCSEGSQVEVLYVLWVKKVACISCSAGVHLHPAYELGRQPRADTRTVMCRRCGYVFRARGRGAALCPACGLSFDPRHGPAGRVSFTCPHCGQRQAILEAARRRDGPPEHEMYALEYACPVHGRGFKRPDDADLLLFNQAAAEFARRKDELVWPHQEIPPGFNTRQILNYGYRRFWEMFNERQLLCLNLIIEGINRSPDRRTRELLYTAFSNSLQYNNMFCVYNSSGRKSEGLFNYHAYIPRKTVVEGNVWGGRFGRGSFQAYYEMLRKGKEYCRRPFEKRLTPGGRLEEVSIDGEEVVGRPAISFEDLVADRSNVLLLCQTSEELGLPDGSVDAVITDPPYYDNVMYSELSDFYYVWLRELLSADYPELEAEHTPKLAEIVKNPGHGKDDGFFLEGLSRVFSECSRVLKEDGVMVFTFHHRKAQAWSALLAAVLEAGFAVTAVFPVHAETSVSMHIKGKDAIEYDAVVVCRKRSPGPEISWEEMEDRIYFEARRSLEELTGTASGRSSPSCRPSKVDVMVVVLGKCLQVYSQHYPRVAAGGKPVGVEAAVQRIWEIVDDIAGRELEPLWMESSDETDPLTRACLACLAASDLWRYTELNKALQARGLDVSALRQEELLREERGFLRAATPFERRAFLERKLNRGDRLTLIDRIHYLYLLYHDGKPLPGRFEAWVTPHLRETAVLFSWPMKDAAFTRWLDGNLST